MAGKPKIIESDYLIIGTGLAGLYSAFCASKRGTVSLITKSTLEESNSYWAQGGIAAAIDPEDSTLYHEEDTLKAGRGLCYKKAVEILVTEGRERVLELIELGMKFDTDNEGYKLGLEGGHSKRRVLHADGTSTGREIIDFVINEVSVSKNIRVFEHTQIYKLLCNDKACHGAIAINYLDGDNYLFESCATIMATGGASALYKRSTNPPGATGDGIALAYNEGVDVMDMEFIQFHPTSLYLEDGSSILISEAMRGEGAVLLNHKGKRFMKEIHPDAELAPRDLVAGAIFREIKKSGHKYLYLSVSHLDPDFIRERFANIYNYCLKKDIDITKDFIPISPAAHYFIGGIKTGLNGETNMVGLYACGEVSCNGVHGSNRLASNSLLECMVFSKRAVEHSNSVLNSKASTSYKTGFKIMSYKKNNEDKNTYLKLKNEMSELMNSYIGIIRYEPELLSALSKITQLKDSAQGLSYFYAMQLNNIVTVCSLIIKSSLEREESRGSHIREKYPQEDPEWECHLVWNKNKTEPQKQKLSG